MFRYMMYLSRYRLSPTCNIFERWISNFVNFYTHISIEQKDFYEGKRKEKETSDTVGASQLGYKYVHGHSILFRTAFILYAYNSLNGVMNYGATSTSAIIFSSTLSSLSRVSYLFPLSFLSFFIFLSFIVLPISSKSSTRTIFRVALHLDYKRLFSILWYATVEKEEKKKETRIIRNTYFKKIYIYTIEMKIQQRLIKRFQPKFVAPFEIKSYEKYSSNEIRVKYTHGPDRIWPTKRLKKIQYLSTKKKQNISPKLRSNNFVSFLSFFLF